MIYALVFMISLATAEVKPLRSTVPGVPVAAMSMVGVESNTEIFLTTNEVNTMVVIPSSAASTVLCPFCPDAGYPEYRRYTCYILAHMGIPPNGPLCEEMEGEPVEDRQE